MRVVLVVLSYALIVLPAFADEGLLGALGTKLHYLSERQGVLSHNIANADTPGYKGRDLAPIHDYRTPGSGHHITLMQTSPQHLQGRGEQMQRFKVVKNSDPYETAPNGNNVILEEQMVQMSKVDMEYAATLNMIGKINGLFKIAIGQGGQ